MSSSFALAALAARASAGATIHKRDGFIAFIPPSVLVRRLCAAASRSAQGNPALSGSGSVNVRCYFTSAGSTSAGERGGGGASGFVPRHVWLAPPARQPPFRMLGQPFQGIVLPSDEASLQRQIRDRPLLGAGVGRGLLAEHED